MSRDRFEDDAAAYLLGALEPGEERRFEEHLKRCARCRDEVAWLEAARDVLPASVEQYAPPPELKDAVMAAVRIDAAQAADVAARPSAPRTGWRAVLLTRPRVAGAVAAVLVAIGVAAGALVGAVGGDDPAPRGNTVAVTVDHARMPAGKGSLTMPADADRKGGAILRVEGLQQPQTGHVYEVWIRRHGQKEVEPSSLFTVDPDGDGAAAIPETLEGADLVSVTREPEGGSSRPSEAPLLTVDVS